MQNGSRPTCGHNVAWNNPRGQYGIADNSCCIAAVWPNHGTRGSARKYKV
jgi:hypothetical protein